MSASPTETDQPVIRFRMDGQPVEARPGETLLQVARRLGREIPRLCDQPGLRPDGNCRACMVEIAGERTLAPACCRKPVEGMEVDTASERSLRARKLVLELLRADQPEQGESPYRRDAELDFWYRKLGLGRPRFPPRDQPAADCSHPAISVRLDACIQCTRCLRACREAQMNDVIGLAFRGDRAAIVFDLGDPMGESSCVGCGECVQACPTGALSPSGEVLLEQPDKSVDSTCPYCGVGCLLRYQVRDNRILYVEGRDGATNHRRLCVKGRYGFNYVHSPKRLRKPLIRRQGVVKTAGLLDPSDVDSVFREASWEEALDFAAAGFRRIREQRGGRALAGLGSAKGSNEEAYLFQKLVRTGFGSNNVDHCTRLCHASSVAALLECLGSGAVSNPVEDVRHAEVIIVIGSNPTVNHPVAATFMKNAAARGAHLIVMDPKRTDIARHARLVLQFRPDTDVALLNGIMQAILEENLQNDAFIEQRTENFDALREHLRAYTPEKVAPICGVEAAVIREVARLYAGARASMIFWGMGITQHVHGTDNARCLISLALMTGQIGRPGTGLHPLRGQNNVQGASDVGLIPMVFPDYQPVSDTAARARFEKLWGTRLDSEPGLTTVEMMDAVQDGRLAGMYIEGENPAMSDPDLNHVRSALSRLDHLVVQDIFLTETAGFADVILPASAFHEKTGSFSNTDRRVQLGRQVVAPPGEARQDLWIIQEVARRIGCDWNYDGPQAVFAEMRQAMPSIAGMTWERLEREDSLTYPLEREGDPGQPVLFRQGFPTPTGRGRFVPARYSQADELPDQRYPWIFITGRQLEHWHTGVMSRHSPTLDALEPDPVVQIHPLDLEQIGARPDEPVTLESRRGRITAYARPDPGMQRGSVFMAFCYNEASANLLTNPALDPVARIPEYKFCAIRVSPGGSLSAPLR